MPKVLIKRGTRTQLDTAKNASGLNAGELYLITDENRLAVGTGEGSYQAAALQGEGATTLDQLSDVDTITTPPTTGQGLVWDGDKWVPDNLQPKDADLDAIAALTGTSGLLKKTAANTWSLDTSTYLTSADVGSTVQGYDADIPTVSASQAEMEAGTESALRSMSPLRVKQAIDALSPGATPSIGFAVSTLFTASGSFTPPVTGTYLVMVCGGGGSGGIARGATAGGTGGGAGGLAVKKLTLSSAVTYTATVGSGGAAVTRSTDGATNGNAGGNSTFSGSDISTITGGGGGAGVGTTASTQVNGASGGTASGGDLNFTGGGSGYVTGAGRKSTGGGAVSLNGTAYASGFASAASSQLARSGGAGVGAASGSATSTSIAASSGGGGSGAASSNASNNGTTGGAAALPLQNGVLNLRGAGGDGSASDNGTAGGDGGGGGASNSVGAAGGFGGGGGGASNTAGAGGLGGGGGGAATIAATITSGKGGDGFILILW